MFIDFLTLLLINMGAGFLILAAYVAWGMDDEDQRPWSLGFLAVGLVAVIFGGYLVTTWPLPAQFNSAFGECTVLLGILFLMAGLGLARDWRLSVIAGYAAPAGLAAIVFGVRIIMLELTKTPLPTGAGFILSGLAGLSALPTVTICRHVKPWRYFAALVLAGIAALWLFTACAGIWGHMEGFSKWVPLTMRP